MGDDCNGVCLTDLWFDTSANSLKRSSQAHKKPYLFKNYLQFQVKVCVSNEHSAIESHITEENSTYAKICNMSVTI
jgi:hypothetical protein